MKTRMSHLPFLRQRLLISTTRNQGFKEPAFLLGASSENVFSSSRLMHICDPSVEEMDREFKVILGYIVSSRLVWTRQDLLSKTRITFGSGSISVAILSRQFWLVCTENVSVQILLGTSPLGGKALWRITVLTRHTLPLAQTGVWVLLQADEILLWAFRPDSHPANLNKPRFQQYSFQLLSMHAKIHHLPAWYKWPALPSPKVVTTQLQSGVLHVWWLHHWTRSRSHRGWCCRALPHWQVNYVGCDLCLF